jgi:hypothetical protein
MTRKTFLVAVTYSCPETWESLPVRSTRKGLRGFGRNKWQDNANRKDGLIAREVGAHIKRALPVSFKQDLGLVNVSRRQSVFAVSDGI